MKNSVKNCQKCKTDTPLIKIYRLQIISMSFIIGELQIKAIL